MSNSVNLSLDVTKTGIQNPLIKVRQGDGGFETLHTTVTSNGEPLDLQGWTITFMGTTAGNHKIVDANVKVVEAPNGIFDYTPSKAWGMDIGEFQMAYFKFVKGDGSASSANFRVSVIEAVDLTQDEAKNYISVVDATIADVRQRLTNSLASVTSSVAATSSAASSLAVSVSNTASSAVNKVNTTASSAVNTINTTTSSAVSQVNSAATSASSVASSAVDNVSTVASNAVANVNGASNTYVKKSGDTMIGGLKGGQTNLPDTGDLNTLTDTGKYYQTTSWKAANWTNRPSNAPSLAFSVDVIGQANQSVVTQTYFVHTTSRMWVRTMWTDTTFKTSPWVELANDANVVHNAGTETIAGDKTFTGNTTLTGIKSSNVKTGSVALNGLTLDFRQTVVGVNVYMHGTFAGTFGTDQSYVTSSSVIPSNIDNPKQPVVLTIVSNGGVGGVTTNSPWELEVLVTATGAIQYRAKNLRDNDTTARSATIAGASSAFYTIE